MTFFVRHRWIEVCLSLLVLAGCNDYSFHAIPKIEPVPGKQEQPGDLLPLPVDEPVEVVVPPPVVAPPVEPPPVTEPPTPEPPPVIVPPTPEPPPVVVPPTPEPPVVVPPPTPKPPAPVEPVLEAKTQNLHVAARNKKIDILFVVDNSFSMAKIQTDISLRIQGFLNHVSGLDYHIAVTSTDPRELTRDSTNKQVPWGDGLLRPFEYGPDQWLVLTPTTSTPGLAQFMLGQSIQMGDWGNGDERGIRATYRAIERKRNTQANRSFFRDDAALAVVLISDEDECGNGACLATSPESRPEELIKLVDKEFGENKIFTFHSILFPETGCVGAHIDARTGYAYKRLSELTGGVIGNVCSRDYASDLSNIGKGTEVLVRSVRLDCEPKAKGNSSPVVQIYKEGRAITPVFGISKDRLIFEEALGSGNYRFEYYCER